MTQLYDAVLKTREEMERDIPRKELGWWHDVSPGEAMVLRDATPDDLARCHLNEGASRNHADYLCENVQHGWLVNRRAVKTLKPVAN
jgi:hypothetical protein